MKNILILGSSNIDIAVHCDVLPQSGSTVFGSNVSYTAGGKGLNQALQLSQLLGERVKFVTSVGEDEDGKRILEFLEGNNVCDKTMVHVSKSQATGRAFITVSRNDNTIVVLPGANGELLFENIASDMKDCIINSLKENTCILICQNEVPFATTVKAFSLVPISAIKIWNPSPVPETYPQDVLSLIDVLCLNENELFGLLSTLPDDDNKDCSYAFSSGVPFDPNFVLPLLDSMLIAPKTSVFAVVTLGSDGCCVLERTLDPSLCKHQSVTTKKIEGNSVGAGDAFLAGLSHHIWHETISMEKPLTFEVIFYAAKIACEIAVASIKRGIVSKQI